MDEARVAAYKKNAARTRAVLIFVDESGLSIIPFVAKTWSKRGKTPVLVHRFHWTKLSAISGVTERGKLYFRVHRGAIKTPEVIAFLRHLLRHIRRRPIDVVWDGVRTHWSKQTMAFVDENPRLRLHRLPAYSPNLNPDEWFWQHLKNRELASVVASDVHELRTNIRHAVMRIRQRPKLIRSFIRASGLPRVA